MLMLPGCRTLAATWFVAVLITGTAAGQSVLPPNAQVVERVPIPASIHKNRELVLWMVSPQRHDRGPDSASHPYTCPESTTGSYFSGRTRVSLADTVTHRLINTENIQHKGNGPDTFNIPYRIQPGLYQVPGTPEGREGKPALLALRDTNGDGIPLEVPFFEADSCASLQTMLIGYSVKQDRVIRYALEMKITDYLMLGEDGDNKTVQNGDPETTVATWVEGFFARTPNEPGHWQYEQDMREYNYPLLQYDVRYDAEREIFAGKLKSTSPPRGQY